MKVRALVLMLLCFLCISGVWAAKRYTAGTSQSQ